MLDKSQSNIKTVLVIGATSVIGRLTIAHLLDQDIKVRALIQPTSEISDCQRQHAYQPLSVIRMNLMSLTDADRLELIDGVQAVVSCSEHRLTFMNIFGKPRDLLAKSSLQFATALISQTNNQLEPLKFVQILSAVVRNKDLHEVLSWRDKAMMLFIRILFPLHRDHEKAAEFWRTQIGQHNKQLQWVIVRPDTLIDEDETSDIVAHASPTSSAIFDAGKTSRTNVGKFIADLFGNETLWQKWRGKMPVIYNFVD